MENISIEERLSKYAVNILNRRVQLSQVELAKIEYGVSILLINILKVLLIYLTSYLLNSLLPTILTHSLFCLVRKYAKGFHARSSTNCTLLSIICFSVIPWIVHINGLNISLTSFFLIGCVCGTILFLYAPADTKKALIKCEKQKRILRMKTLGILIILLFILAFMFKETERLLGLVGIIVAVIFVLPIEKILWRD